MFRNVNSRNRGRRLLIGNVGLLAACSLSAIAQQAEPATEDGNQVLTYGTVVVTAQKREQSIDDIAAAVSVTDGEFIEDLSISDAKDLVDFVPGLTIRSISQGNANPSMRGVGTAPGSTTFDQSVAFFLDGIYAGRSTQYEGAFLDVQRIEIIKGPQSTLLGKNASLGAISVVSRKPTETFEAHGTIGYELENQGWLAEGAVSGPLAENVQGRLSARSSQKGGWIRNSATNNDTPELESMSVRGQLAFQLGHSFDGLLFYQYDDAESVGDAGQYLTNNSGNITDGGVPDFVKANTTLAGEDTYSDSQQHRISVLGDWTFGDYVFTSQSTYTDFQRDAIVDVDGIPYHPDTVDLVLNPDSLSQFTQELRLTSPESAVVPFILGVFYAQSNYEVSNLDGDGGNIAAAPIASLFPNVPDVFIQDTWSIAAFGSASYEITERIRLNGGLRYTYEEKEVDHSFAGAPFVELGRESSSIDGNLSLQLDFTDNIMGYVSYGHGTKSGGFSEAAAPAVSEVDDEVAESYEVGLKSAFYNGRVQMDANLFYTEVTDFQFTQFTGTGFVTANINATTQGGELNARLFLTDGFQIYGNAVYADARDDRTDERLERAPLWDGLFGAKLEQPVNGWTFIADLNGTHTSMLYNDPPRTGNPVIAAAAGEPITKINLRLALQSRDEKFEVALTGRNLFNESTIAYASPDTCSLTCLPPEAYGPVTEGRTIMVQGTVKY